MWKYNDQDQINDYLLSLKLLNCNKKKYIKTLYSISNNIEKNYKKYKIKKKSGKMRTIYEPNEILKHIQKNILENVLSERHISNYAIAYRKGYSLRDNVMPHVGQDIVLKLDIENFFDSIDFIDVYNSCFPIYLYPKSVGQLLTYLCCYDEHLPQGAPTSACISNLYMREFDEHMGKWCLLNNINYTRYSDDMTFSGNFDVGEVIKKVISDLRCLGLKLNKSKIHVVRSSSQQTVTGVVVNEKAQVSKQYRKEIRQEIYYIQKFGLESHMKHEKLSLSKEVYIRKVMGKILFVLQINENDKEFISYKSFIKDFI